jgi:uncharacterized protein YacL (UPF0231 family)
MKGKLFFDPQGYPRAEYSSPHEVLGWYLEQDIQCSEVNCEEILRACDQIVSGNEQEWGGVGNAHDISITADRVRIENLFSDVVFSCELTVEDFRQVVQSWKELIEAH